MPELTTRRQYLLAVVTQYGRPVTTHLAEQLMKGSPWPTAGRNTVRQDLRSLARCGHLGAADTGHGRIYQLTPGATQTAESVELGRLQVELAQRTKDLADTHAHREQLRTRNAELEALAAAQQRKGYEKAIEVMRQEGLPMSVGLLEAQLELDRLDGPEPTLTIYRASWDSMSLGRYTTEAEARKHAEDHARRDLPTATFDWIVDEEDGVAELIATVDGTENSTGYTMTALEIASKYDPEADE